MYDLVHDVGPPFFEVGRLEGRFDGFLVGFFVGLAVVVEALNRQQISPPTMSVLPKVFMTV